MFMPRGIGVGVPWKIKPNFFNFFVQNPSQSFTILTTPAPFLFIFTSKVLFYLLKLLFWGFYRFKGNIAHNKKTHSIWMDTYILKPSWWHTALSQTPGVRARPRGPRRATHARVLCIPEQIIWVGGSTVVIKVQTHWLWEHRVCTVIARCWRQRFVLNVLNLKSPKQMPWSLVRKPIAEVADLICGFSTFPNLRSITKRTLASIYFFNSTRLLWFSLSP